jgi:hypothetical protein
MRSSIRFPSLRPSARLALGPVAIACLAAGAHAQVVPHRVTFSIDYMSPSRAAIPASHGDVLAPAPTGMPSFGAPPPIVVIPGGPAGFGLSIPSYGGCIGTPPGTACPTELDALSYGADGVIQPGPTAAHTYEFSVDEFARGWPGSPLAPNVLDQSPCGDSAADIFGDLGQPGAGIGVIPNGNTALIDGNGTPSCTGAVYPGLGLVEPNMPFPAALVDGDDVDAYDFQDGPTTAAPAAYFSLDANFLDPMTGMPNTGAGAASGFPAAAVLVKFFPGGAPAVYAPAAPLGLNQLATGQDDLDALALAENGNPGYQPAPAPFVWGPGTAFDMLLFSVRRGSAVIGMPDSLLGLPICEGDILIPPVAGGLSPFPGIFVPAENLGLATLRSGTANVSDELDALDTRWQPTTSTSFCFGSTAGCPCGNVGAAGNGCANSVFAVGGNLTATGNAQVSADTVVLTGTNMPNSTALYYQGTLQANAVFGDGLRCVGGNVIRLGTKMNVANTSSYPTGADAPVSVKGMIPAAGGTRYYQCWYRNAAVFCTASTFNLTNGIAITWTP